MYETRMDRLGRSRHATSVSVGAGQPSHLRSVDGRYGMPPRNRLSGYRLRGHVRLGVPKTAKIVDRTLRSDVERLAKETASPRHWADDKFSALVVESGENQQWWQGRSIYRVWKDGLCWKVDHSMGPVSEPSTSRPRRTPIRRSGGDRRRRTFPFRPESLCDGKWYWEYETKTRRPTTADTAAGWPEEHDGCRVQSKSTEARPVERDHFRLGYPLGFGRPTDPLNDLNAPPRFGGFCRPEAEVRTTEHGVA